VKPALPTSLRRLEQRHAARRMADALLRAAARRQRAPEPKKKEPPAVEAGPRRIRLSYLKQELARKRRQ
jgi:hypothetical protein